MKKNVAILLTGALVLSAAIYVTNKVSAQGNAGAAPIQTRIALLNLNYVVKNYEKYKNFQNAVQAKAKGHQDKIEAYKKEIEQFQKALQQPTLKPEQREQYEQQVRAKQRAIEDITVEARKALSKEGSDAMVLIYKEVRAAAQRYATQSNFELVLHFEEATTKAELDTPKNIMRKMNAGGCVPMYWRAGMDISMPVVMALNQQFKAAGNP